MKPPCRAVLFFLLQQLMRYFAVGENLARGDVEKAQVIKSFYDEYFAVLDLPAEFYLETVSWVFQEARLPKGELTFNGGPVELKAIRKTALLTAMMVNAAASFPPHEVLDALALLTVVTIALSGIHYVATFTRRAWSAPAPSS